VPLFLWNESQIAALYTLKFLSVVYLPVDGAFAIDLRIIIFSAPVFTLCFAIFVVFYFILT